MRLVFFLLGYLLTQVDEHLIPARKAIFFPTHVQILPRAKGITRRLLAIWT